ncbi:BON domain-containing protein [bacterium]|nr:MAG: BON domain-containing protein [bacterium]
MRWILPFFALVVGCNSKDASELSKDAGKLAKTGVRAAGNAQLAGRVNAALAQRKGVEMSGLHIEAEGGTVTVGGTARDKAEKTRILDTVRGIRGADKVVDKLKVKGS